jgi:hypothetical protein
MSRLAMGGSEPAGWQRLMPFPAQEQQSPPDLDLFGALERRGDGLDLRFRLQGNLDQLLLPEASAAPARCDGLWQHTCLEAFWGACGEPGYWEWNASPSGDWNLYRFDRYRQGLRPEPLAQPPRCHWMLGSAAARGQQLELQLQLPDLAAAAVPAGALEASLTAVLEHRDGSLSYWALALDGPEPDFHRRDGFVLRL